MESSKEKLTSITRKIANFADLLRNNAIKVGVEEQSAILNSLKWIELENRDEFYFSLRSVLIKSKKNYILYDKLFNLFWSEKNFWTRRTDPEYVKLSKKDMRNKNNLKSTNDKSYEVENIVEESQGKYHFPSAEIVSKIKIDFENLTESEILSAIKTLREKLSILFKKQYSFARFVQTRKRISLRKMIRESFRTGGEIIKFYFQGNKTEKSPVVIIADVSRSMMVYRKISLFFIWIFAQLSEDNVKPYIFSTDLIEVEVKEGVFNKFYQDISSKFSQIGDGTRLSDSIQKFNQSFRKHFQRPPVVIIFSDGLSGKTDNDFSRCLRVLRKNSYRVLWVNPLSGHEKFNPKTSTHIEIKSQLGKFYSSNTIESVLDLANQVILLTNIA